MNSAVAINGAKSLKGARERTPRNPPDASRRSAGKKSSGVLFMTGAQIDI